MHGRADIESIQSAVEGLPHMSPEEGRRVVEHLRRTGARDILELGTAYGVGTAYLALAAKENGGRVTTVDRVDVPRTPSSDEVLSRADVVDAVEVVRLEHSSYLWWLMELIERQSDADGNCEPIFDFCYLDGAHTWAIDGFAVVLVERLLRPGGWLLLDDLNFSFANYTGGYAPGQSPPELNLSDAEIQRPHMRAVFDLVVKPHPAFTEFRIDDDQWGWAHKAPGAPRRLQLETSTSLGSIVVSRLRRARERLRR